MRVAANRRNTFDSEIEWLDGEASRFKERHDEAAQAAINVQTNVIFLGKLAQRYDVILASVREIDR